MYDVIYFNVWSDIICTAAKLLHGTSETSQMFRVVRFVVMRKVRQTRSTEEPTETLQFFLMTMMRRWVPKLSSLYKAFNLLVMN